jgi:hypothetical protein
MYKFNLIMFVPFTGLAYRKQSLMPALTQIRKTQFIDSVLYLQNCRSSLKRLLFIFVVLLSIVDSHAQTAEEIENRSAQIINSATDIFEGIAMREDDLPNDGVYQVGDKKYCILIVRVKKVLKGSLKKGTVRIVSPYYPPSTHPASGVLLCYNALTFFFCIPSDYPSNPASQPTDNSIVLKHVFNEHNGAVSLNGSESGYPVIGLGKKFKSKDDFYTYLKKYPGITVPKDEQNIVKRTEIPEVDSVERKRLHKLYIESLKENEQYMLFPPGDSSMYRKLKDRN